MRRARRHQRAAARERVAGGEERLDRGDDLERLGDPSHAALAIGERAVIRPDLQDAARPQQRQVRLRRPVMPHHDVHRRRDEDLLVGGEQRRGGEVVRHPCRHAGEQIGGGGRDDDQIGLARQADMPHLALVGERPQIAIGLVLAEGGDRERRDELLRRRGQDAAHRRPALAQPADEVKALIGRDATGNDQKNAPSLEHRGTVGKGVRNHFTLSTAEIGGKAVRRRHFLLITEKIQEHGSITLASTLLIREP